VCFTAIDIVNASSTAEKLHPLSIFVHCETAYIEVAVFADFSHHGTPGFVDGSAGGG